MKKIIVVWLCWLLLPCLPIVLGTTSEEVQNETSTSSIQNESSEEEVLIARSYGGGHRGGGGRSSLPGWRRGGYGPVHPRCGHRR